MLAVILLFRQFQGFHLFKLIRQQKTMFCLFFLNFKLTEWISILWNIPLVYCFIDKGAEYSHMLAYRVDL